MPNWPLTRAFIPYGAQRISKADIERVTRVMRSDFLTQGPVVPEFERELAAKVGAKYSVAASSATGSLHLAYMALGLQPGHVVWTTPISFVATANAARYCGADVEFVDIDESTFNLSAAKLEQKLLHQKKIGGRLPHIVVTVHLAGLPTEQEAILELSRRFGFKIVEDASHALGAKYNKHYVGSCRYSDVTVFSFHPVKIITTAEGGIATTNDLDLARRMASLRSHGIRRNPDEFASTSHGDWFYEMQELGYNYRMNEIQAALGLSQLRQLDKFMQARSTIREYYEQKAQVQGFRIQTQPEGSISANHLVIAHVNPELRKSIFDNMRAKGIGVNVHYIPIPMHPYYGSDLKMEGLPAALDYYRGAITLPIYPGLKKRELNYITANLRPLSGHQSVF